MLFGFVFQNTYTNAAKLLEAARHLASSGECNNDEIQKRVDYFEQRVQEFINRVNRRKTLLNLAVNFYSRTQKVSDIIAHIKFGVNYQTYKQGVMFCHTWLTARSDFTRILHTGLVLST